MDTQEQKYVMIIDEALPLGIIANTAAVLGISLGEKMPDTVGIDVIDGSGNHHLGITEIPIPILKGNSTLLKELRKKLYQPEFEELIVVDFCDVAQSCKTYEDYTNKIAKVQEIGLQYFGIALCGRKKIINKLTGNMPLLR